MKPSNPRTDYGFQLTAGVATVVSRLMATRTWKQPVVVATTVDIDLTTDLEAGDTIDGVVLAEGDRVLVWQQTTATENGIYDVPDTGTGSRSSDFDSSAEIVGSFVVVLGGTQAGLYRNTNSGPITLGVDDVTFEMFTTTIPAGTYELAIEGGQDVIMPHGSMGATETFDPTDGNVHTGTLTADCTFTLNAPSGSGMATLEYWITQDGTGGWDITWPGSVTWDGGTPTPDTTAGVTVRYLLESIDGGTSWIGNLVGSGGGTPIEVFDEGVSLTAALVSLDFVGAGVTATAAGDAVTITIPGATSSGTDTSAWQHAHINTILFSADGSTTAFTLPAAPVDPYSAAAYVAGVRVDVALSGTLLDTMTFSSAPASGTDNILVDIVAVVV